jgi:hypothetical protein
MLFPEQRVEAAAGVVLLRGLPFSGCIVDENKVIAEVAPLLFNNALGLGLAALVVSTGAVKRAVQADVQIGPAGRARLLASHCSLNQKLFPAGMTDFHKGILPSAAMGELHDYDYYFITFRFRSASQSRLQ